MKPRLVSSAMHLQFGRIEPRQQSQIVLQEASVPTVAKRFCLQRKPTR